MADEPDKPNITQQSMGVPRPGPLAPPIDPATSQSPPPKIARKVSRAPAPAPQLYGFSGYRDPEPSSPSAIDILAASAAAGMAAKLEVEKAMGKGIGRKSDRAMEKAALPTEPKQPEPQRPSGAFWFMRRPKPATMPEQQPFTAAKREQVSERATVPRQVRSSEMESGSDDSKNFTAALAVSGALLGTGLYRLAEHDWWFGGFYTAGGALVFMSVTPLIRSKIGFLRSPQALWVAISVTWLFLAANIGFSTYEHFWSAQSKVPPSNPGSASPEKWPALTNAEAVALADRVRAIPPEDIVVACETINCRDLADGIADILLKTEGWKVSVLHRGGFDITGVTGIRLNPNEPATQALKEAIESTSKLKVAIGPDTRKDIGSNQTYLTVGTRPF